MGANGQIYLRENLRFLRQRLGLTQESLAAGLGMTRVKLKAIESGQTANPVLEDVITIARFFKLAADTLLTVDLSKLGELKLRELESGTDVFLTGKNIRVLAITITPDNKENVDYVPIKVKAGYRSGYSDPVFLATLPKFNLPNLPTGATFRMFATTGDSMLPIPEDSEILARYVHDWTTVRPGSLCIVVLDSGQDFVFKQVMGLSDESLHLGSLNRQYQDYQVPLSEVLEIWEYYSFHSRKLPEARPELAFVLHEIRGLKESLK